MLAKAKDISGDFSSFIENEINLEELNISALQQFARMSLAALKENQALLQATLDKAAVGFCQLHVDGRWAGFNQRFCDFFGYTQDEFWKTSIGDISHPEELALEQENMTKLISGEITSVQRERRFLHKNGSVIWGLISASATREDNGKAKFIVGVLQDITKRKSAENELKKSLENRDQFLATLSHELRTPLNIILGWVDLLKRETLDPWSYREALDTLEKNARIQKALIDDLLDVSRIVTGKMILDFSPVQFKTLVESQLVSLSMRFQEKNLKVKTDLTSLPTPIMGDSIRLTQVISNILTNAIKFTPPYGQIFVTLKIQDDNIGSFVQLTISDSGNGIEPNFLDEVFEPLKQEEMGTTRTHGGLGLGLAIAKHTVLQHNGKIFAKSEGRGKGAEFTVDLPLLVTPTITPAEDNPPKQTSETDLTGVKVLLVDDSEDVLSLVEVWLRKKGVKIKTAKSAKDAFDIFRVFQPQVLLSDIGMPEEDGYSLLAKIRALSPQDGGQVPAAALTAYARDEEKKQALAAGFQIHIPKPFTSKCIEETVALLTKA